MLPPPCPPFLILPLAGLSRSNPVDSHERKQIPPGNRRAGVGVQKEVRVGEKRGTWGPFLQMLISIFRQCRETLS